jgi:hypothetical protein
MNRILRVKDKKALNALLHRDTSRRLPPNSPDWQVRGRVSFMNGVLTRLHFSKRIGKWGCWLRVWQVAVLKPSSGFSSADDPSSPN